MRVLDYIFAARPLLLLPVWSVYFVSLHLHLNLTGENFALTHLLMLAALSMVAGSAYYFNQIYDRESDRQNNKVLFLQKGIMSERNLRAGFLVTAILSLAVAAWFSLQMLLLFAVLFLLSYLYSAPPLRLKDRPFWGFFANAFGFGFLIPFTVMPNITEHNAGLLGWDSPFYFFLTIGAVYVLTTLPDRDGDLITGKRTVAVIFPRGIVIGIAILLLLASAWVAYYSRFDVLLGLSLAALLPVVLSAISRNRKIEHFAVKFPILMLTLLAGYFFWGYILFVVALIIGSRIYYRKRFLITYPKLT